MWYLQSHSLLPPNTHPEFGVTETGKPILVSRATYPNDKQSVGSHCQVHPQLEPPLGFNISHDGNFVLFGVNRSAHPEVGVDLMAYPKDPCEVQEALVDQVGLQISFSASPSAPLSSDYVVDLRDIFQNIRQP